MLNVILLLTIAMPMFWLGTEFQDRRWIRISAGCAALALSFLVAAGVGSLEFMNANSWYGAASKDLIDATVERIERGDTDLLLKELKILQEQFQPTYQNHARYDKLIEEFKLHLAR